MAETKAKSKASKSKPKAKAKKAARPASKGKSNSRSNGSGSKGGSNAKGAKSAAASANGHGAVDSVKEAVANGASGIAPVAQKAKLPLLATGAALAGAAVVIAGKNGHKRKVLGVPVPKHSKLSLPKPKVGVPKPKVGMPNKDGIKSDVRKAAGAVTDAAKQADELGKRISRVASSVQTVGETARDAAKKA